MDVLDGICTWRYGLVKDGATGKDVRLDIAEAVRAQHGTCPLCGGELVAKKGELRNDHWAHINGRKCDDWYEPKGEWHRSWQGLFPKECQEVAVIDEQSGQRHIADIRTSDGLVIECQYSHLSRQEIEERERFYGEMVWLVSGTRLVYDRSRFQPLMDREYIEKSEMSGLYPYIVIPEHGYPHSIEDYVNRFWAHCKKPVFFDFEGKFNEPCQENDLYCLLPDVYNGCRIVAKIPHWDFVDEFNGPDAWEYVGSISMCVEDYAGDCLAEKERQEQAKRREAEREKERKERARQDDLSSPVKWAITCGWVEGWLYVHGYMKNVLGLKAEELPEDGKIAIHLKGEYSEAEYKKDRERALEMLGHPGWLWQEFPQYSHLSRFRSSVIARFNCSRTYVNGEVALAFGEGGRLPDMNGGFRVIRGVPDGTGIWPLSEELVVAVNDRAYRQKGQRRPDALGRMPPAAKSGSAMVYTGKGNLYRDAKSGWLHILRNGVYIPLRKENQNWDKTYDARFGTAHKRNWW